MKFWPEEDYLRGIIDEMKKGGYSFLNWVTMNSRKFPYYTTQFGVSQHSRIFFRVPDCAMVLMLEYIHREGRDQSQPGKENMVYNPNFLQAFWSIEIWASSFKSFNWKGAFSPDFSYEGEDTSYLFKQVGYAKTKSEILSAEQVWVPAVHLLKEVEPILHDQFDKLDVTRFAPNQYFPRSARGFWHQFETKRLNSVAYELAGKMY